MANAQESEYMHDAMFIYNKPKLNNEIHENQDYVLSSEVVKFAVDIIKSWGYRKIYRHGLDALPGSNILDEFFHSGKASRFTVVVLTRGFLDNCRKKYESHAAFFSLLDKNELKRFVVLYLDYDEQQIPDAFKTMNSLSFSDNWRNEKAEWENLKRLLENITQPVQDTGPDPFRVTQTNFGSQNAILNSRGNLQHPQAALPGLEFQANSFTETDAGPHDSLELVNLKPVNPNTTNSSDNENASNQQSGGGIQQSLGFSVTQSNEVIYQRNRTNGLNSNITDCDAISTDTTSPPITTLSTDSFSKTSHISLPPEQFVRQRVNLSETQSNSGSYQGLDLDSFASDHQDTNNVNTEFLNMNRPNVHIATLTNISDGYESMDGSATNSQGASLILSTMRQMLPGARSTMRNTVGRMFKQSVNFVNNCDQSFI